jgi:hypothetical protein
MKIHDDYMPAAELPAPDIDPDRVFVCGHVVCVVGGVRLPDSYKLPDDLSNEDVATALLPERVSDNPFANPELEVKTWDSI